MNRIILALCILLSLCCSAEAGEWSTRVKHPSARHDWVRGDDPVFNTVNISDSLTVNGVAITGEGGGSTDWELESQGTIHASNYVDNNTTYSASDFNHDDLSNITGTAGQYNHPTDAQMTVLGNTSGTNTGDQVLPTRGSLELDTDDTVTFANLSGDNTGDQDLSDYQLNSNLTDDVVNIGDSEGWPGGAASDKDYASFYLSTGGVTNIAGTETTLVVNSTSVNSDDDVFSLASNQITVNKTGTFLVTFECSFNSGGSSRTSYGIWLDRDDVTEDGTYSETYQRGYDNGDTATCSIILPITSGEVFQLRVLRVDGAGTTGYQDDNGTRLTFLEL